MMFLKILGLSEEEDGVSLRLRFDPMERKYSI